MLAAIKINRAAQDCYQ